MDTEATTEAPARTSTMDTLTSENVMTLKVSELKAQLTERGLPAAGIKSSLQKRLLEAVNAEAAAAPTGMDVEAEAAPAEPEETIDESVRYSGTIGFYNKRRGFGRIIPEGKTAEDKDSHVFCHWKQIQSEDSWPSLSEGQKVEYYLGKKVNPKNPKKTTFAAQITLEGGSTVSTTESRTFPDRSQRFAGTVKFFDPKKGFGFLTPKEDFCFDDTDFPANAEKSQIYVAREDITTADGVDVSPSLKDGAELEFTLGKAEKDGKTKYSAADVTKIGGEPLGTDDFKPRRKPGEKRPFKGKKKQKGKKKGKGKNQKRKLNQAFQMMGGMKMIPLNMGGGMQPQIMMINGQAYMVQAPMGMGNMMGVPSVGFGKKKRRRKNKKGKKGGSW
jgi:cold shock CspA family protein